MVAILREKGCDAKQIPPVVIITGGFLLGGTLIIFSLALLFTGIRPGDRTYYPVQPTPDDAADTAAALPSITASAGQQEVEAFFAAHNDLKRIREQVLPILSYNYSLPPHYVRKSQAFSGSNPRLRRVVHDLLTGENEVRIGVIGGSVSWGHGTSNAAEKSWFAVLGRYLRSAFPAAKLHFRNGCIPASPTAYVYMCLELSIDADVDLLFVEYLLNDGFEDKVRENSRVMMYERLVRKVLKQSERPAVAMMQVLCQGDEYAANDGKFRPFPVTLEEVYGAVAEYYDLAWLSVRNAVWDYVVAPNTSAIWFKTFMNDDARHPNDVGHRFMADIAVWMIQRTAIELLTTRPYTQWDADAWRAQLPPPMYPGNLEAENKMCVHNEALKELVVLADGWEFKNEAHEGQKPKLGYVSTQPGSVLKIRLNTVQQGRKPEEPVAVLLAYLKSYEHMGVAHVSCVHGCSCSSVDINAHHDVKESTIHLQRLIITQHEQCTIAVIVTRTTHSHPPEHKFRVSGVMMSDETTGFVLGDGVWGAQHHHQFETSAAVTTPAETPAPAPAPAEPARTTTRVPIAHAGDAHPANADAATSSIADAKSERLAKGWLQLLNSGGANQGKPHE